jgi:formate C-acetyltransferase
MAVHMNIFEPNILKKAQKNPEKYATLQVRVCGWNVYFINLSKEEQDAFIKQAESIVS